jgi:lactate permease
VEWYQNYDPLHSWALSTLASALPVLTLFFVLLVLKQRVWTAAFSGMLMAMAVAAFVLNTPPKMIGSAALLGAIFGLTKIAWIIIASIFVYHVAVETGQFQVMKESIAGLSSDSRLQLILIAFCFGAFLEGTGGGGAPVAIAGSFLIGLGFNPFQAATLCLVANTAPVAWGGAGNPIRVLAGVTALPEPALSAMTGRILPLLSCILPLWLVRSMVGWRQTLEVWPAIVVSGISFASMQFYWSNFQETGLVDIVAGVFSLIATVAFLKAWKPKTILENESRPSSPPSPGASQQVAGAGRSTAAPPIVRHSTGAVLRAWSPFILASVFIFVSGVPSINKAFNFEVLKRPFPALHNLVMRVPPVVPFPAPEPAIADLNVLANAGTAIFLAGIISALGIGLPLKKAFSIFGKTFIRLTPSMLAICFMLGLAFVTKYSGSDTTLGLSMTRTGRAYPFFGTLLGWLGVALTGTDASSNALFGNLQKVTAGQLGLSPVLMAAANSSGGVMGKMIDAQSIVVSSTATLQVGNEAAIFRAVFKHSIILAIIVGLIVTAYAFWFTGLVPDVPAGP